MTNARKARNKKERTPAQRKRTPVIQSSAMLLPSGRVISEAISVARLEDNTLVVASES